MAVTTESSTTGSQLRTVAAAAAGLAAAMGVGRFAYTPMLPIMTSETGLSASAGAVVATANYAGYLIGAVVLSVRPRLGAERGVLLGLSAALVLSELAMPVTTNLAVWLLLRFVAGVASAGLFVGCVARVSKLQAKPSTAGLVFVGVGLGIALTGVLVVALGHVADWRGLWSILSAVTVVLLVPLTVSLLGSAGTATATSKTAGRQSSSTPGWRLLMALYFLEGVGYIVVGTFLVASVVHTAGETLGPISWIVVGLAAAPGTIAWTQIGGRFGLRQALLAALVIQAVGALIPAISGSAVAAMIAAAMFGATFMGITAMTIAVGVELRGPEAAGPLTAIYGLGQMLGPLVVAPVLGSAFTTAFEIAAATVAVAALLAVVVVRRHLSAPSTE